MNSLGLQAPQSKCLHLWMKQWCCSLLLWLRCAVRTLLPFHLKLVKSGAIFVLEEQRRDLKSSRSWSVRPSGWLTFGSKHQKIARRASFKAHRENDAKISLLSAAAALMVVVALCMIFMILVSLENVKKCALGGCTITWKTKINVVWNFFSLRWLLWGRPFEKISNNVHPVKMRPKLWKSHIVHDIHAHYSIFCFFRYSLITWFRT